MLVLEDFRTTTDEKGDVHNIQANVPVENIVAVVDAIREFNVKN